MHNISESQASPISQEEVQTAFLSRYLKGSMSLMVDPGSPSDRLDQPRRPPRQP
jgi:hypothetical protein